MNVTRMTFPRLDEIIDTLMEFTREMREGERSSRSAVKTTIEKALGELPAAYTDEPYEKKCELIYRYVLDMNPPASSQAV